MAAQQASDLVLRSAFAGTDCITEAGTGPGAQRKRIPSPLCDVTRSAALSALPRTPISLISQFVRSVVCIASTEALHWQSETLQREPEHT